MIFYKYIDRRFFVSGYKYGAPGRGHVGGFQATRRLGESGGDRGRDRGRQFSRFEHRRGAHEFDQRGDLKRRRVEGDKDRNRFFQSGNGGEHRRDVLQQAFRERREAGGNERFYGHRDERPRDRQFNRSPDGRRGDDFSELRDQKRLRVASYRDIIISRGLITIVEKNCDIRDLATAIKGCRFANLWVVVATLFNFAKSRVSLSDSDDGKRILNECSRAISEIEYSFNAKNIGNALYGLQNMDASSEEVKGLLKALTVKIRNSRANLNGQAIGNSLYGLQNMNASSDEVKDLLKALTVKIEDSEANLNIQEIGNALYGLQKMEARSKEVKDLLTVLNVKIRKSRADLDAQAIGNALYGLQNMEASSEAVKGLLTALTVKIRNSRANLNEQHIGNALYGLKNMEASSEAVKGLLTALTEKISKSRSVLDAQHIGNALYGLQNMEASSEEVKDLLIVLTVKDKQLKS